MVFTLLLLVLTTVSGLSAQNSSCQELEVSHGSTWLNVTWLLHCNLTNEEIINIERYTMTLTDLTTEEGIYSYLENPFCMEKTCSILFENMRPCIKYLIELTVTMLDGSVFNYSPSETEMDEEKPSLPRGLGIEETTSSSITTKWFPPQVGEYCIQHYEVCAEVATSAGPTACITTDQLTAVSSDLIPCNEYYITVRSFTFSGTNGDMAVTRGVCEFAPPSPPMNLRSKDNANDYIGFYWDPPTENAGCVVGNGAICIEANYQLPEVNPGSGSNGDTGLSLDQASDLYSEVSNLQECTFYDCYIQIPVSNNSWVQSEIIRLSTSIVGTSISSPQYIQSDSAANSVTVFWASPLSASRCVEGYYISWTASNYRDEVKLGMEESSYTIRDLEACENYMVRIWGYSQNWGQNVNGSFAQIEQTTLTVAPGPVRNLEHDSAQGNSVIMCWDSPDENSLCVDDYEFTMKVNDVANSGKGVSDYNDTILEQLIIRDVKLGETVCKEISPYDCNLFYEFCVWPVTADGQTGPRVCTDVLTAPCTV